MISRDVRIWGIKVNDLVGRRKSYTPRWSVAGKPQSKTFTKRALAEHFRSDLLQAAGRGEGFDTVTGLPQSMAVPDELTVFEFALTYVDVKWGPAAAKSRDAMTDALATVLGALTMDTPNRPAATTLRSALRGFALPPATRQLERPAATNAALTWLERASLPVRQLADSMTVRAVLDAVATKMDGKPAATSTMRRKRAVFYNLLQYAVERELLDFNPIDKLQVHSRRPKVVTTVDRRVVVNPRQARELFTMLTYVGERRERGARLVGFFACLYLGALRPGEGLALRERDCYLPDNGWGRLTLEKSRPQSGKRWTNSGDAHDERGLKHRGEDEPREVPIPPELVRFLRQHIESYGVAKDGRLFQSPRGGVVGASTYSRVWDEARRLGLTPQQVDSPLAGRPYDLRHAGVSLWLNAGVPAPEVAQRAGHSVEVLLKVYAKCIDGQETSINGRIDDALGGVW